MRKQRVHKYFSIIITVLCFLSCTRSEIQFGDNTENSYASIVFTDSVSAVLSTVIVDSFATNNPSSFLLGRYNDPKLGTVSTKNFFQMSVPGTVPTIPETAVYDSLTFIFRLNDYYYGDTSLQQTFYVNELAEAISYSYNSSLYNTSSVPVKIFPLGSKTIRIRPVQDDSVEIRLSDTKGLELFSKLKTQSIDVLVQENFSNYFYGISLATGNDFAAIYGINAAAGNMVLRVHYHTTVPLPEKQFVDFSSLVNDYAFNNILSDRSGTGLVSTGNNLTEIPASQTNDLSFLQSGTGVLMKMTFPSLHNILSSEKIVRLIKAELYVRPAYLSFDRNKYKLPELLSLSTTDASNSIGNAVPDSTGINVLYANPVIDDLYGENTYYRFNVTSYINNLLINSGTEDDGFYLVHSSSSLNVSRLIANNAMHGSQSTKLLLYLVVINK